AGNVGEAGQREQGVGQGGLFASVPQFLDCAVRFMESIGDQARFGVHLGSVGVEGRLSVLASESVECLLCDLEPAEGTGNVTPSAFGEPQVVSTGGYQQILVQSDG